MTAFPSRNKVYLILAATLGLGWSLTKEFPQPKMRFFPAIPAKHDRRITLEGIELGRRLFYDPVLSADSSMSCGSCHQQQYAFGSPNPSDTGISGIRQPRNTLPLFNLVWYDSFFWDGKTDVLEHSPLFAVSNPNELNLPWIEAARRISSHSLYPPLFRRVYGNRPIDSLLIADAIGQFMRSLLSNQSKYDRVIAGKEIFNEEEKMGFVLVNDMTKGACLHCHPTDSDARGSIGTFANNGLDDYRSLANADIGKAALSGKSLDTGRFKIPSLRNLLFTAPYMHDGRFATLEEVMHFYNQGVVDGPHTDPRMTFSHRGGSALNPSETRAVIAFLKTLSDSSFVQDARFSNPWTTPAAKQ
ncbi:MAG TPA: cytochrome c peroxidase [Luteibaculaceae bacterium]|nr:cytochrome c peroxidase [Luteibaculaceae bacterium]